MTAVVSALSLWLLAFLVSTILIFAMVQRVSVYESFIEGAKGGFETAIDLIPHLVAMMVAITIFRESGAMDMLLTLLHPLAVLLGIPQEIFPLAMIRPISGSGALGITTDIIQTYGPDSFFGRLASTMQGSTDTTLFILAVYFGAVGIKRTRYALKVGLVADLVGALASVLVVRLVFG